MIVPLATPETTQADADAVAEAVLSGWLTTGKKAQELESRLKMITGKKHALVGSSLTALVAPLISALPFFRGAAFPAWTFSSVPMEFWHAKKQVKLFDVDPDTFMLPVAKYSQPVIVPTHLFGNEFDCKGLREANPHQIIIDDAAHLEPRKMYEHVDATLYSFYATKPLCAGEGGAVVLDDGDTAKMLSSSRLHGFSRDAFDRYSNPAAELYEINRPGWKANMPDTAAALALSQLDRLEEMMWKRSALLHYYRMRCDGTSVRLVPHDSDSATHIAVVVLPEGVDRREVRARLGALGVSTSVHFIPLYRFEFWARELYGCTAEAFVRRGSAAAMFPVCEEFGPRVLSLPLFSAMTVEQAEYVMDSLISVMEDLGA